MPPHMSSARTPLIQRNQGGDIPWRRIWSFVSPFALPQTVKLQATATFSLVMVVLSKLAALLQPYAYKLAVDDLAIMAEDGKYHVPYGAVALYVFAQVFAHALNCAQNYSYSLVSADCTKRFGVAMFRKLQNLSLAFHLQRRTGEVTRIMDRGINSIDIVVNTVIFTIIPTLFEAAVVLGIFFKLGTANIAITTLVTVGLYFAFTFYITTYRVNVRRDLIDADNAVSEKSIDTLINYETVKMFGMEQEEVQSYHDLQHTNQEKQIFFRLTLNFLNLGQSFIQYGGVGLTMIFAARGAVYGTLTPGDFVLVNQYVMQLFMPLFFLGSSYRIISQAMTDLEKCMELYHTEITVKDSDSAVDWGSEYSDGNKVEAEGRVSFQNVSFKYEGSQRGEKGGLRNVSFDVAPGKMVAFVGASGTGKSTIVRLLLRFYDVDGGAILIDGKDLRSFSQRSLRKNIGVVAQDTVLFNQSLRYNISYGKQEASDAEIFAAARSAALGNLIEGLPEGLDTVVGERGVRLSGGERQRVGCARCIIKAPTIVLLDEASSALDSQTEREMQNNIREVCKGRTTLMVAHRLSTVMRADEIIVLGKDDEDEVCSSILERGTHFDLLRAEGKYAEMWEAQTNHEEEIPGEGKTIVSDVSTPERDGDSA